MPSWFHVARLSILVARPRLLDRLAPRQPSSISVRREGDGTHLPGSPFVLEAAMQVVR